MDKLTVLKNLHDAARAMRRTSHVDDDFEIVNEHFKRAMSAAEKLINNELTNSESDKKDVGFKNIRLTVIDDSFDLIFSWDGDRHHMVKFTKGDNNQHVAFILMDLSKMITADPHFK